MVSNTALLTGSTYEVTMGGTTTLARVLSYNPIDGLHTVSVDGKAMRLDLSSASVRRRRRAGIGKKTPVEDVFLYMCDIGNGMYKIGVSADTQRRQKQIKTYSGKATMRVTARIPTHKSAAFRAFEKAVLERFAHGRTSGGTEVRKLSTREADECAGFMRSICARA